MRLRRFVLMTTAAALSAAGAGRFDQRLSKDQQIVQALNRLTFGPRPGDVEQVRRVGVEKWIELQMHPEQIAENQILEQRLKPLETVGMDPAEILKRYPLVAPALMPKFTPIQQLLTPDQVRRVLYSSAEDRRAVVQALDPEKRKLVMAVVPSENMATTPELQKESNAARQQQQEERTKELRRIFPPVNELLQPDQVSIAQRGTFEQRRALFDSLELEKRRQLAAALPLPALAEFHDMRALASEARTPQQILQSDLREARVFRAIYSNRQLEEVLVDFWLNHFNVYAGKQSVRPLLASYEREAIRPHVLGHFKDLLLATARHPAMLYYLDNWESVVTDALQVGPFAGRPLPNVAHGLNENYGRELMELHTLGVNGGYTQQDVIAVARCFTGWTIRDPNAKPEFTFADFMHDHKEKTVLGHKIAEGGGEQDGLQVIDILAHHPATARFISRELAQRFVADNPPQALVDRMAQTFTKTDGDLRAVLRTLFTSREFLSEGAWEAKMKSPLEMVVSAVRASGAEVTDTFALTQRIADLGEPLYEKIEPTGYPNSGEAWLNTASLMGRINFATALMGSQVPGAKPDASLLTGKDEDAVMRELLNRAPSPETKAAIDQGLAGKSAAPQRIAVLVMSSPDFQRR